MVIPLISLLSLKIHAAAVSIKTHRVSISARLICPSSSMRVSMICRAPGITEVYPDIPASSGTAMRQGSAGGQAGCQTSSSEKINSGGVRGEDGHLGKEDPLFGGLPIGVPIPPCLLPKLPKAAGRRKGGFTRRHSRWGISAIPDRGIPDRNRYRDHHHGCRCIGDPQRDERCRGHKSQDKAAGRGTGDPDNMKGDPLVQVPRSMARAIRKPPRNKKIIWSAYGAADAARKNSQKRE